MLASAGLLHSALVTHGSKLYEPTQMRAPSIFGPIRRFHSKFGNAPVPGKNSPTHTVLSLWDCHHAGNEGPGETPEEQRRWNAYRKPASQGGIQSSPNWVKTNPTPNPNTDAGAKILDVVIGPSDGISEHEQRSLAVRLWRMRKQRNRGLARAEAAARPHYVKRLHTFLIGIRRCKYNQ
jgi:hypothetical protein